MTPYIRDVHQQPGALRRMLHYYRGDGKAALEAVRDLHSGRRRRLLITGMGSSYFAPMAVLPALTDARAPASIWESGELLHYHLDLCDEDTLLVAVSQSGESFETRRVVEEVGARCAVVTITNDERSFIGRAAQIVLPLYAGDESTVSTKTYSNSLAVLHLLATAVTGGSIEEEIGRLDRLAREMEESLGGLQRDVPWAATLLEGASSVLLIARGPALAAAHQTALTFNEAARLQAAAMPGGTFRHGPLELLGREFAAVLLAPTGRTSDLMVGLAREVAESGARVILVTDSATDRLDPPVGVLSVPNFGEDLFPLSSCLALELLVAEVATLRGIEPGVVQRIGKITTRE